MRPPHHHHTDNAYIMSQKAATSLKRNEYVRVIDRMTGEVRVEKGENSYSTNNETGDKAFRHGPTTFFLEPFTKLLEQRWSTGIHKNRKDLAVSLFDSRPHFMWYDFEARTRDNVELVLSITFFWAMSNGGSCLHLHIVQHTHTHPSNSLLLSFPLHA